MNYLAHAYLSFNNPERLVGNMISDYVKGAKKYDYANGIQKGIALHRLIDTYTDEHPVTKELKQPFRPAYRLYAGAFIDVVYDHFLAKDQETFFNNADLLAFSQTVFNTLDNYTHIFPDKFLYMYPYMKSQNWLYNYQFTRGIEKSFGGLVRRAAYISESETAFKVFTDNYDFLQQGYISFFKELKSYTYTEFVKLIDD